MSDIITGDGARPLNPDEVAFAIIRLPDGNHQAIYNFKPEEAHDVEQAARELLEALLFGRFLGQLQTPQVQDVLERARAKARILVPGAIPTMRRNGQ